MTGGEIKLLYPILYKEILRLSLDRGWSTANVESKNVNQLFSWSSTPQGDIFWSAIQRQDWDKAKSLYPNLFKTPEEVGYTVVNNGLFK